MHIQLDEQAQAIIEQKLKTGRYENPNQVVRAALGLFRITPGSLDELRGMVDEGITSLDRGEGRPLDIEAIKREGRRRLAE